MTRLTSYQKTQVQCIQAQINYTSNLLKDFNDHKEEIFKLLKNGMVRSSTNAFKLS